MEVTTSTCYLCHFKESDKHDLEELSDCRLCHKKLVDKDIEHKVYDAGDPTRVVATSSFNHVDFIGDSDVNCKSCHLNAFEGEGPARRDRCFVCHNDPVYLERITEIEFIHDNHITEHNVTCERCHDQIKHEVQTQSITLEESCAKCHVSTHGGQREIFVGIGGKGVDESMPDVMYRTMVDCSGCHVGNNLTDSITGHVRGYTKLVDYKGCENCHGEDAEGFIEYFQDTMNEVKERLNELKNKLAQATVAINRANGSNDEMKTKFEEAEYNLKFIEISHGWAHNSAYSTALLDYSEEVFDSIIGGGQ